MMRTCTCAPLLSGPLLFRHRPCIARPPAAPVSGGGAIARCFPGDAPLWEAQNCIPRAEGGEEYPAESLAPCLPPSRPSSVGGPLGSPNGAS